MSDVSEKRILVVDDEDDVREYLVMALEDAGFQVETASDGYQAMEKVRKNPPDLISLDLVMPKRSGAKLYHDLKRDSELSGIPVILVTGHARDELGQPDFEELTMSGVGVYLEKPVKPASYVRAVCRVLEIDTPAEFEPSEEELRKELEQSLSGASSEELQRALDALRKKG